MPSPFPGMNPYLEHADAWNDFQDRPDAGVWPVRLREALPPIHIPLRAPHPDL